MGRSVTDLEGKGTVCHGLYCDMSSSTGRDIYPVPSWIQKKYFRSCSLFKNNCSSWPETNAKLNQPSFLSVVPTRPLLPSCLPSWVFPTCHHCQLSQENMSSDHRHSRMFLRLPIPTQTCTKALHWGGLIIPSFSWFEERPSGSKPWIPPPNFL